ncbi:MAG: hypothetical protein KBA50_03120 [Sedimentibacter sp.]|nr:hypothetical protein [Sedimentibacter sp.]
MLKILVILLMAILFYEDIRHRSISILWIAAALLGVLALSHIESRLNLINIILNLAFVMVQVAFISLYLLLKGKQIKNIFKDYIGLGDVAFWIIPVFYLDPIIYVFYVLLCYLSALIIFGTVMAAKKKSITIPLAGSMALVFGLYIVCEWCGVNFSLWANSLIIQ